MAIDRHQQGIRMHLNAMSDNLDDTNPVDDPVLLGFDEGDGKAFLVDLQKPAEQAAALATR